MVKIAVPSSGESLESEIDPRFGRCKNYIIVDSETMVFSVLPNASANAAGGAGIQAAQLLVDNGVTLVLGVQIGPNALQVLSSNEVDVVDGMSGTVKEAVEKFKSGELSEPSAPVPVPPHSGMSKGAVSQDAVAESAPEPPAAKKVVAIPSEKNEAGEYTVAAHFGRCPYFVVATIEDGKVTKKDVMDNPYFENHQPFVVPEFLAGLTPKPDVVITGGMGPRAIEMFSSLSIAPLMGASGTVDAVLEAYAGDVLELAGNVCVHEDGAHGDGTHGDGTNKGDGHEGGEHTKHGE